ncbi:MAG: YgjV family protein [Clostridia bacterium]|nr:YgjV family protein [Clostridia bacterium]
MTTFILIAEILSVLGMIFNSGSFLQKSKKGILIFQFFGALFFSVSFFMLNAPTGALLNIIAVVRAFIYANKEKFRADKKIWLWIFFIIYVVVYLATFLVFDKEWSVSNCLLELLPVISMTVVTISFSLPKAKHIRYFSLIGCPLWLIYNIFTLSIGGIICESLSIISSITGIFFHDRKKKA